MDNSPYQMNINRTSLTASESGNSSKLGVLQTSRALYVVCPVFTVGFDSVVTCSCGKCHILSRVPNYEYASQVLTYLPCLHRLTQDRAMEAALVAHPDMLEEYSHMDGKQAISACTLAPRSASGSENIHICNPRSFLFVFMF